MQTAAALNTFLRPPFPADRDNLLQFARAFSRGERATIICGRRVRDRSFRAMFAGYENADWFIPAPALKAEDADLKLSPDQIRETLNYFSE